MSCLKPRGPGGGPSGLVGVRGDWVGDPRGLGGSQGPGGSGGTEGTPSDLVGPGGLRVPGDPGYRDGMSRGGDRVPGVREYIGEVRGVRMDPGGPW